MKIIAFVVLNYKTPDKTIDCVMSLLKLNDTVDLKKHIIIVDNGSEDSSALELKEKIEKFSNIHLLSSQINLGFARGNNLGMDYARQQLKADFVVTLNSDIQVLQQNMIERIQKIYLKHRFSILGPDIVDQKGNHHNPLPDYEWTKKKLRKERKKRYVKLTMLQIGLGPLIDLCHAILRHNSQPVRWKYGQANKALYGAFWVFSEDFFKVQDHLNPDTFLYLEEDILYLEARKKNILIEYTPEIRVLHYEGYTSEILENNKFKREINRTRNWIASSKILETLL